MYSIFSKLFQAFFCVLPLRDVTPLPLKQNFLVGGTAIDNSVSDLIVSNISLIIQ